MPLSLERPISERPLADRPWALAEAGADAAGTGRIAVVDIGYNSIRLVIYDGIGRAPTPLFNEKVMCGLGRAVERTGRLNPEGVALAVESLTRFGWLIRGMDVARVEVLATAAVRDAADGGDFIEAVRRVAGLPGRVIDGVEEARLSALGGLSGTPEADGLIGDLGGGSLEIVGLERGAVRGAPVTLPVGPLRLIESSGAKLAAAAKQVDQHLDRLDWLGPWRCRDFYPVGGSW